MSTYLTPGKHGSSPRFQKADSLDEKYTKRRKQEYVAEVKQQQLQQKQLLTFGGIITFLFISVLVFFWGLPNSTVHPERSSVDISRKVKNRRHHHLRDASGDSADRRNKLQPSADDEEDDDDDIAVVASPVDQKILDKRMAKTIEDLKRFQEEKILHLEKLQHLEKNNPNVHQNNDKQGT